MRIEWYPSALDDLEQFRTYIARNAPSNAEVVAHRVVAAVEALTDFPEWGRLGRVAGTRELVVPRTPYLVACRVREDVVEILRVLHGAQRWPSGDDGP